MIKCSVCIPTYKRPQSLNNLLSCLLGNKDKRIGEIIIAVTGRKKDSIDMLTKEIIRAMEIEKIQVTLRDNFNGLLFAKEYFKNTAKEEILLIVDDDCIISRNYLDLLLNFKNKNVGAVSGCIQTPCPTKYYKDYSYDAVKIPAVKLCNKISVVNGVIELDNKYQVYMSKNATKRKYLCECLIGSAMFIRKDLFEVDKNFNKGTCHCEEYDYTYSLYKKGYSVIWDSSRVAYHLHLMSGGMRAVGEKKKEVNAEYFIKKYGLK